MVGKAKAGLVFGADTGLYEVTADRLRRIVELSNYYNFDQSNMASGQGVVVYGSSPPSDTDAIWNDSILKMLRAYDGTDWQPLGMGVVFTNRAGAQVTEGDPVRQDAANDKSFTLSATLNTQTILGSVAETIANGSKGVVRTCGIAKMKFTSVTVPRARAIAQSATSGKAYESGFVAGAFAFTVQQADATNSYVANVILFGQAVVA